MQLTGEMVLELAILQNAERDEARRYDNSGRGQYLDSTELGTNSKSNIDLAPTPHSSRLRKASIHHHLDKDDCIAPQCRRESTKIHPGPRLIDLHVIRPPTPPLPALHLS